MTTLVSYAPMPPLVAAAFVVNGFDLPEVTLVVDSQGKTGYHAFTTKDDGRKVSWAELLSPRSPEDAVERLAREILRNRQ